MRALLLLLIVSCQAGFRGPDQFEVRVDRGSDDRDWGPLNHDGDQWVAGLSATWNLAPRKIEIVGPLPIPFRETSPPPPTFDPEKEWRVLERRVDAVEQKAAPAVTAPPPASGGDGDGIWLPASVVSAIVIGIATIWFKMRGGGQPAE